MVNEYRVIWTRQALAQLQRACKYIRRFSFQNAEKIRADVFSKCNDLCRNPARHPKDKLRKDRDIQYRAFEAHKLRISFYIDEPQNQVFILRVRNTKQEPLEY